MKIIRKKDIEIKNREDGRIVVYYPSFDIPDGTKQIGFITVDTPRGCKEDKHKHPVSTEIFYHLTPGKIKVNDKIHLIEAGDIVVLEPGDEHKQIADEEIKIIALRIPFSLDKEYVEDKENGNC